MSQNVLHSNVINPVAPLASNRTLNELIAAMPIVIFANALRAAFGGRASARVSSR